MKTKHIITFLTGLILLISSCVSPDMPGFTEEVDLHNLKVYGLLNIDNPKEYEAVIDNITGNITIEVPYYISDTEPIQGDLTQMRVRATMPLGASFEPKLQGLRDLEQGFKSTIYYADGTSKEYNIKAEYVKSGAANIIGIKVNEDNIAFVSRVSATEIDGVTDITVIQFGYNHLQQLKEIDLTIESAPWSVVNYPNDSHIFDVTDESKTFTITAQDGTVRTYRFKIIDPSFVPEGMPGSIAPLFGFKVIQNDDYGWEPGVNRSMAVIGDEIIIASLKGNFHRINRFTGAPLTTKVNRTGIAGDVHGIANDDAGNLVATVISSINNQWVPNHTLEIYVWKGGIEGTPTKIYSQELNTDPMFKDKNQNANTGRTIGVTGDVTSGKARLGFVFNGLNEFFVLSLQDGEVVKHSGLIAPSTGMALTNASKAVPMGVEDNDPVAIGMMNDRTMLKVEMDGTAIKFSPGLNWWPVEGNTKGFDFARFNGMDVVALGNGENASWDSSIDWRNRLIVTNIADESPIAMTSHEILDSFKKKYDPNTPDEEGDNDNVDYGRLYGWLNERVGTNGNKVGDAVIYVTPDGTAMYIYLMVTDMGMMGWEITKFAL